MRNETFINISKIIERDSKSTTYKFASLRGVIDIIQENSPFIKVLDTKVQFPTGLLVEKWLLYYYPILDSPNHIPQIHGSANLAFQTQFVKVIDYYKDKGGLSVFYNDLRNKGISPSIKPQFIELIKQLKDTITKMPMKYIGRSINNDYYSIFQYQNIKSNSFYATIDSTYLVENMGYFTIPIEYFEAFKILGSFLSGQDSILIKWAEFSSNASGNTISIEKTIEEVLKNPVTQRDVLEAKKLYKGILQKSGKIYCVWTGKTTNTYDIDHLIPFSIWKNNDLWNLLPAQALVNNHKRNKIPSPTTIEKQKDLIIHYWELINDYQHQRFLKEINHPLIGSGEDNKWQTKAIDQLKSTCDYLINTRGYEEWKS